MTGPLESDELLTPHNKLLGRGRLLLGSNLCRVQSYRCLRLFRGVGGPPGLGGSINRSYRSYRSFFTLELKKSTSILCSTCAHVFTKLTFVLRHSKKHTVLSSYIGLASRFGGLLFSLLCMVNRVRVPNSPQVQCAFLNGGARKSNRAQNQKKLSPCSIPGWSEIVAGFNTWLVWANKIKLFLFCFVKVFIYI